MQQRFSDLSLVEVQLKTGEWIQATVYGFEERDGVGCYYVQRYGYAACNANDPTCWYTAAHMRAA